MSRWLGSLASEIGIRTSGIASEIHVVREWSVKFPVSGPNIFLIKKKKKREKEKKRQEVRKLKEKAPTSPVHVDFLLGLVFKLPSSGGGSLIR